MKIFQYILQKESSVHCRKGVAGAVELRRISPELQPPRENDLYCKYEQHTDTRSSHDLDKEIQETSKAEPFEEDHITVMEQGEHQHIDSVRGPLHCPGGGFPVIEFCIAFRRKNTDHKRSYIGNERTGRGMQTRCHGKIIKDQPGEEADDQQPLPGNREREPENEEIIYIRSDESVQVRHLIQYIHLYQDKDRKTDDIS